MYTFMRVDIIVCGRGHESLETSRFDVQVQRPTDYNTITISIIVIR